MKQRASRSEEEQLTRLFRARVALAIAVALAWCGFICAISGVRWYTFVIGLVVGAVTYAIVCEGEPIPPRKTKWTQHR